VADTLNVEKREQTGSLRMKRMRQSGKIPAVLYGHGEGTEMLSVLEKELSKAVNNGSYIVELKGAANEGALIKSLQWDAFGIHVLHVDLTRVNPNEAVEVTLTIELKGDAAGTHHGGVVNFHQHELSISCPANAIPEKLELKISDLDVGQSLSASDVPLPAGATLAEAGTTPIVSCALPADEEDDVETEPDVPVKGDDT
jgi:large subunit ribosomal protein L25